MPKHSSWRRSCVRRSALVLGVLMVPLALGADSIQYRVQTVGGGSVESGNIRLSYTIAEPLAGPATTAALGVQAGLQATFPFADAELPDAIFGDGFE